MSSLTAIALVPARAGSKRVRNKNIRLLDGHPLIAYTVQAALQSGVFREVVVSTEAQEIADMAARYGAEIPFLRPPHMAEDQSPDIEWVEHTLNELKKRDRRYDCFSILRPTSPFRQPETIRRALALFERIRDVDSIRAVEPCRQHPMKMWVLKGSRIEPLMPGGPEDPPWHSTPYQALPKVYAQNASLEIAWSRVALEQRSIAGRIIAPFFTKGFEGFDINDPYDWIVAEEAVRSGDAKLPRLEGAPT